MIAVNADGLPESPGGGADWGLVGPSALPRFSKLHAASRRSAIAQALVEFGGLQRTIYALRYLADEAYRRRITRQLNKGESLHSLRRDLFFAHEGSVRRRHHEQQTEQALCLSLVVNAIITWNTAYLELALEHLAARRRRIDRELLAHVSPALMEHVNPYGTYEFPVEAEYARTGFRPLRDPSTAQAAADQRGGSRLVPQTKS